MDYKYYEGKIGYLKNIEKLESLIQEIKLDEELSTGEKLDLEKRINKEIEKLKDGDNYYQLIKRSGFVNQVSYSEQAEKRKQVYMLSSGSVLNFKAEGNILDLNLHGKHSIYRMGKPIILGVKI